MTPILGTKEPKQAELLSVDEAYILWRVLADTYTILNHFNELRNFAHDKDFKVYLTAILNDYRQEGETIEKLLGEYAIPAPRPNAVGQNTVGNSEVVLDKEIAATLFSFMRLDLNMLINGLKDTHVNDKLRKILANLVEKAINRADDYIKYLKLKGWIDTPPQYPSVVSDVTERIGTNEIFLLWDHLVYRYHNLRLTRFFSAFVADKEFKVLLEMGVGILTKQAEEIEQRLLHFGVTLPRPFTPVVSAVQHTEVLEDEFMFSTILRGIKDAIVFHGSSLGEIIVNDDIRAFFTKLTLGEIDLMDKMTKYGRVKGWVLSSPTYRSGI